MKISKTLDGRLSVLFLNGKELVIRNFVVAIALLFFSAFLFFVSLNIGTIDTGLIDFWKLIKGDEINQQSYFALWDVRLPRLALAFLIGWSVAVSGAILQPIARNPLADPGLFGISHGSLTMTIVLLAFIPGASRMLITLASLAGGLGTALLLLALVGNRHSGGLVILLMGIAVATAIPINRMTNPPECRLPTKASKSNAVPKPPAREANVISIREAPGMNASKTIVIVKEP